MRELCTCVKTRHDVLFENSDTTNIVEHTHTHENAGMDKPELVHELEWVHRFLELSHVSA